MSDFKRIQSFPGRDGESAFFWGARQTGKSTLLRSLFPDSPYYDLLKSDEFRRLSVGPWKLREELLATRDAGGPSPPVIIDEVQKIPELMDEIQVLMVEHGFSFILCGSSARKLKRGGANLLGGRALRYELFPLVSAEIPDFDLLRALNHGLIPRHYLAARPDRMIDAYIGDYLKEEIASEALTRNLPAFGRFLESAAFSNGEIVKFSNVARECGVSGPTAKDYFEILIDTHLGRFLPSFRKRPKRRVILAPKFYYFDLAVANLLLKRGPIQYRSESFGKAFEHFILQELIAHSHYSGLNYPVTYWRTASGSEVDFILGDHEVAIEVKGREALRTDLAGLRRFQEEYNVRRSILISLDPRPRTISDMELLPCQEFLTRLWDGGIMTP